VDAAEAPVIATLDGDGQNDPADIPALYQAWRGATAGVSLVTGYRRRRHDTWLKRFSSRVANAVRGGFLNDNTPDTGCGLKVFSRETFRLLPRFDHMHRFLPALVQMQGGKTLSVEVNHRERRRGTSKYGMFNRLWVGIVDLLGVKWLQRRTRRPVVSELL
jgi:dolichol-phosphate mannosyltransferase